MMTLFTGRLIEVGIGKESPRGTGLDPATFWIPKTAITFSDKITKALVTGSYGNITNAAVTGQVVNEWAEGNIEGEVNANSFGLLLLALVGTENYSLAETGVGQHDYTLQNDVQHDSLTIWVNDPIGAMWFRMAMINTMTIDVALGEYVKYTANFVSKSHQDKSTPTPSYSIDHRFVHPNLSFKVGSSVDDLGSAISLKNL